MADLTVNLLTSIGANTNLDHTSDMGLVYDASANSGAGLLKRIPIDQFELKPTRYDHSAGASLNNTTDVFSLHTNLGATAVTTITLPAAVIGMQYDFLRVAAYALHIDANGSEVIGDGAGGKYLSMETNGRLRLTCYVTGVWTIEQDSAGYIYEI
jgi:hypothetical protein